MNLEKQIEIAKRFGGMVMIDGHPHSYSPWTLKDKTVIEEHHELFSDLSEEQRTIVENWILSSLIPRKTINECHSSYGLKHLLQHDTGIYLYENQFCDAMLQCGYEPKCYTEYHWYFGISQNSPAFK